MSQYYGGESQWSSSGTAPANNTTWDHQTPPPARSGASSTVPREEQGAFASQYEEVERAIENLVKSGKMFNAGLSSRHGRGSSGPGPRQHSVSNGSDYGGSGSTSHMPGHSTHSAHSGTGLQNFYASQRHQPSRGSNEAEQMMQAKRRMAAQRERELRNYHQEQQFNRILGDMPYSAKSDRSMSPGTPLSEDERRRLIERQRSALYGEGPFENGGFVDENGLARPGAPGLSTGVSTSHRGPSPLAYDYNRGSSDKTTAPTNEGRASRAASNASPQSNPPANRGFDSTVQQSNRTSNSSPGGSPPRQGGTPNQNGPTVAPIGTRPNAAQQASNPALNKRSTTPLPSPLSHAFNASTSGEGSTQPASAGVSSNPPSASADGYGSWSGRAGVWGKQSSGLGVQASVWG